MPPEYNSHFSNFFRLYTQQLATIIPPNTDLSAAYENGTDDQQAFVQNLALFYTGFFRVSWRVFVLAVCCAMLSAATCLLELPLFPDASSIGRL